MRKPATQKYEQAALFHLQNPDRMILQKGLLSISQGPGEVQESMENICPSLSLVASRLKMTTLRSLNTIWRALCSVRSKKMVKFP